MPFYLYICIITHMKLRKGFTLLEVVVTMAILGISTALTVVVAANLANVQNASATQFSYSKQINDINDIASKYVSFVSLNTKSISFTYASHDTKSITFNATGDEVGGTYWYRFGYNNETNTFGISTNYSGDVSYLIFDYSITVKDVKNDGVNFTYNSVDKILTLTINLNGMDNHLVYVVRA